MFIQLSSKADDLLASARRGSESQRRAGQVKPFALHVDNDDVTPPLSSMRRDNSPDHHTRRVFIRREPVMGSSSDNSEVTSPLAPVLTRHQQQTGQKCPGRAHRSNPPPRPTLRGGGGGAGGLGWTAGRTHGMSRRHQVREMETGDWAIEVEWRRRRDGWELSVDGD
jgi:hypothetical protein